jgi:hypothetical protein
MVIHTVGDSHSRFGWNIDGVIIHWLGPKLCYSIGRDGINLSEFNIKQFDTLVFAFGEIDCRCHVHKFITSDITYESIIDRIVEAYFQRIKEATIRLENVNVAIFNVVPPVHRYDTHENPSYPYLGTDEERRSYVLYFNLKLEELSKANGYLFFNVYDKYSDRDGFLRKELSDGNVHISDNRFIKEFLEEHHLLPQSA